MLALERRSAHPISSRKAAPYDDLSTDKLAVGSNERITTR
jgi:hypothetical protein